MFPTACCAFRSVAVRYLVPTSGKPLRGLIQADLGLRFIYMLETDFIYIYYDYIWRFPEMGVPSNHPFLLGFPL